MTEGIPAEEVPEQLAAFSAGTVTAACVGGNTDNGGDGESSESFKTEHDDTGEYWGCWLMRGSLQGMKLRTEEIATARLGYLYSFAVIANLLLTASE